MRCRQGGLHADIDLCSADYRGSERHCDPVHTYKVHREDILLMCLARMTF